MNFRGTCGNGRHAPDCRRTGNSLQVEGLSCRSGWTARESHFRLLSRGRLAGMPRRNTYRLPEPDSRSSGDEARGVLSRSLRLPPFPGSKLDSDAISCTNCSHDTVPFVTNLGYRIRVFPPSFGLGIERKSYFAAMLFGLLRLFFITRQAGLYNPPCRVI